MKADTTGYVTLQQLYKAKAKEDLALVQSILAEVLAKAGVSADRIGQEETETFVKHVGYLKVIRGRSLRQEFESSLLNGKLGMWCGFAGTLYGRLISTRLLYRSTANGLADPDSPLPIYIALLASEKFHEKHGRYPGTEETDEDGSKDVAEMTTLAAELVKSLGESEVDDKVEQCCAEV